VLSIYRRDQKSSEYLVGSFEQGTAGNITILITKYRLEIAVFGVVLQFATDGETRSSCLSVRGGKGQSLRCVTTNPDFPFPNPFSSTSHSLTRPGSTPAPLAKVVCKQCFTARPHESLRIQNQIMIYNTQHTPGRCSKRIHTSRHPSSINLI